MCEEKFFEMVKHHSEHFKVIIKGEFEVKLGEAKSVHEFKVESNHVNTAIDELRKKINTIALGKVKDNLKDLRDGINE